jgi:hypothetical protein
MILISHRGNVNGPNKERENGLDYIDEAINAGYEVEIDLWSREGKLYLGHDAPQYAVAVEWLENRLTKLWVHCKNIEALEVAYWFKDMRHLNYFWHETDTVTLTSQGFIWAYPGKQPIINSIAVMPELYEEDTKHCIGICSDYINRYK